MMTKEGYNTMYGERARQVMEMIRQEEEFLRVDFLSAMPKWLDVMGEWAESNEYGHRMHVVVNDHGEPYCTDEPDESDFCWENLVAAYMDWSSALDGYRDDPLSKWYVLDDNDVQVNMWSLASVVDMRNALKMAIADRYTNL